MVGYPFQWGRNALPELRRAFCDLWNDLVRESHCPDSRRDLTEILEQIHPIFIDLHSHPGPRSGEFPVCDISTRHKYSESESDLNEFDYGGGTAAEASQWPWHDHDDAPPTVATSPALHYHDHDSDPVPSIVAASLAGYDTPLLRLRQIRITRSHTLWTSNRKTAGCSMTITFPRSLRPSRSILMPLPKTIRIEPRTARRVPIQHKGPQIPPPSRSLWSTPPTLVVLRATAALPRRDPPPPPLGI